MKHSGILRKKFAGLRNTISRFVLPFVFLVLITLLIALQIGNISMDVSKYVAALVVGTFLGMIAQVAYERFFSETNYRFILMAIAVIFMVLYYLTIYNVKELNEKIVIRTLVLLFALFIAFIWIPVIRNKYNFNQSFMITFKAIFTAVFFALVLFLGVVLILAATNFLITYIDARLYAHAANLIFVLFGPLYYLSLIPLQPVVNSKLQAAPEEIDQELNQEIDHPDDEPMVHEDEYIKSANASRFLETLITYVIIPVTAIFTVILLLYLIMNITGSFWTDNLLEPMLVAYSILVIVVYLLASQMNNLLSNIFKKVFPKVLVPIVLFQTISSILRIGELGITHGRYYVILFGFFATISGFLYCFLPVGKNGIIAPILLALCLISLIPPIDAFTISRINQTNRLEKVLTKNQMLQEGKLVPKSELTKKDQEIIKSSFRYLENMNYITQIGWMKSYRRGQSIEQLFGFSEYGGIDTEFYYQYFYRKSEPIPVSGYDIIFEGSIYQGVQEFTIASFDINQRTYELRATYDNDRNWYYALTDEQGVELISFPVNEILDAMNDRASDVNELSTSEVTFTKENDQAILTIILENINISVREEERDLNGVAEYLIKIK